MKSEYRRDPARARWPRRYSASRTIIAGAVQTRRSQTASIGVRSPASWAETVRCSMCRPAPGRPARWATSATGPADMGTRRSPIHPSRVNPRAAWSEMALVYMNAAVASPRRTRAWPRPEPAWSGATYQSLTVLAGSGRPATR